MRPHDDVLLVHVVRERIGMREVEVRALRDVHQKRADPAALCEVCLVPPHVRDLQLGRLEARDRALENAEARPFGDSNAEPLPGHGILATIHGILDRDGSVCVMPGTWTRFGEDAGINLSLAAKQLEADEILVRSSSAKKGRGTTFQSLLQLGRGSARKMIRCYRLFIPDEMVDDPTAEPPTPPATGPEQHLQQETPLPATGANMPVTTPVTGATGVTGAITHSARKESDVPTSRLFDRGGHEGWSSPLDPSQPCTICCSP